MENKENKKEQLCDCGSTKHWLDILKEHITDENELRIVLLYIVDVEKEREKALRQLDKRNEQFVALSEEVARLSSAWHYSEQRENDSIDERSVDWKLKFYLNEIKQGK